MAFTLKWSTPPRPFLMFASRNAGSSNMDQMIPKAARVSMFPAEVDLSVCWMDFYCYFFVLILFPLFRAPSRKYRPTVGTSSKFDVAHFLFIDNL